MKRDDIDTPTGRDAVVLTSRRHVRGARSRDPSKGSPRRVDVAFPMDGPVRDAVSGASHATGGRNGASHPNGGGPAAQRHARGAEDVVELADAPFRWTPTGIAVSYDQLSLTADDARHNDGGQRCLITVRWNDQLCHRQRINLEDPCQRDKFIKKLLLSCRQAGMTEEAATLSIIAGRVTPALLIQLAEECRRRPETPPTDPQTSQALRTAAEQRADALLRDPDILGRVGEAMQASGYAGKLEPAVLAYVALTSRFLERPLSLAFVADPATGKNATIDAARELIPPEAVYVFTASSPTALIYKEENLEHRIVIFREADSIPDRGPAAAAIRALAEENVLRYEVTIRGPRTGSLETWKIEKAGPTGLMTTSTRPLAAQLHTRLLPVRILNADDRLATLQVICAKGDRAAGILPQIDLERFLAFQRWLAVVGERRVIVPFAPALARAMGYCSLELRTRRDFEALLSCVKTIAFLHQRHRKRAVPGGEIVATVDDYWIARRLLIDSFSAAAAEGLTTAIRELVGKIGATEEITRVELGERLSRPRSTLYYQVAQALELKLLSEEKRGGKRFLRRDRPLPDEQLPLPDVEDVEDLFLGVPGPRWSECLKKFISDFTQMGSTQGITAAEWAGWVGQPVGVVSQRLDALAEASTLAYDPQTERYAVNSQIT